MFFQAFHPAEVNTPPARLMRIFLIAAVLGLAVWYWKVGAGLAGFQNAGAPLAMPQNGEIDERFQFLSAWEMAQIPRSLRFDPPMGSEHGGLVYNAQKFMEMNVKRGGHHSGDDLNGIGGMNTDLGDPVFSIADGWVVYAAEPSPGWGKTLIVAHKTSDGRTLHSMYAHLHGMAVTRGARVARGMKIGSVGTSNDYYPAHLHFEIRTGQSVNIGAGYGESPLNRLDPIATVTSLRNAAEDALSPAPLARVLAEIESGSPATDH